MAITVQEQPYSATKVGQKLIYRLTSSNVANDGFRFVFKIYEGTTNLISTIYVPPTPEATPQGILDLSPVLKHRMDVRHKSFIAEPSVDFGESDYPYYLYKVTMQEGYNVAGVFTIQATTTTKYHYLLPCSYAHMDGYKPNPDNRYGLDGITKLLMGDRNSGTHIPRNMPTGLTASSSRVFIPIRDNNMDYGNLYYITDYSDTLSAKDSGISTETAIKMKLVPSGGGNIFATEVIGNNGLVTIPAYPKSLEGSTSLIDPADYPNYKYYSITVTNDTGASQLSAEYVFYPYSSNCIYENVRLAWWSPVSGGFDYFNFDKKNEESIEVERKRVQRVVGNYSTASSGFTYNTADRGLMEGDIETRTYITMTSDYIRENEFALLKNMIRSKSVYIINDDGSILPVVIEENNFTSRRTRDGKLYQLAIKVRYSNEDL
jgi:hypothetical protein